MKFHDFKLLQIDAWREPEGGWTWNNHYLLEEGICIQENYITPRRIASALRRWGYLAPQSTGLIRVDMHNEIVDGYLIEILDRRNGEPVFALSTIH